MAKVGDYAVVSQVPVTLYYSSDRAATRNNSQAGYIQKTGRYRIIELAWTDKSGNWYYPSKGAGTIELYGINDITDSYTIGWVRSDDLATATTFNRVEDFALDTTTKINMFLNVNMEGVSHKVDVLVGGKLIKTLSDIRSSPYFFRFTQANINAILNQIPNATSGTAVFRVTTLLTSDNSQVGTPHSININFSIPVEIKPILKRVFITNVNEIHGQLYQNISSVNVSVEAEAGQGANITSTTIKVGNTTFSGANYNAPVFSNAGTIPIVINTVDSRGRSSTYTQDVNVTAYIGVQMTAFNATRTLNENGETKNVVISVMGTAGSLNDNQIFARYQYKERSSSQWVEAGAENIPAINNVFAGSYQMVSLSDTTSYDIKVILTDGLNQRYEFITTLGTANYPMMWGKHGASFGRSFNNDIPQSVQISQSGLIIGDTVLTEADLIALKNLL